MSKTLSILVGALYGLILSVIVSSAFSSIANHLAGGSANIVVEDWIWWDFVPTYMITYALLAVYLLNMKASLSSRKIWIISSVSAFLSSSVIGTIGSVFGDYMEHLHHTGKGGFETIAVRGILGWGVVYTLALLPITIPLMRLLIIPLIWLITPKQEQ